MERFQDALNNLVGKVQKDENLRVDLWIKGHEKHMSVAILTVKTDYITVKEGNTIKYVPTSAIRMISEPRMATKPILG